MKHKFLVLLTLSIFGSLNLLSVEFPESEHVQKWGMTRDEVKKSIEIPSSMKSFVRVFERNGEIHLTGPIRNIYYFDGNGGLSGIYTFYYSETLSRYQNLKELIYYKLISEFTSFGINKEEGNNDVIFGDSDELYIFKDIGADSMDGVQSWSFSIFLMLKSYYIEKNTPK